MNKRKILAIIIVLIMCLALSACTCEENTTEEPKKPVPAAFIEITAYRLETTYEMIYQYIFYDPETMVMYSYIEQSDGAAITPMYNADGTLRIYTPNIEAEK